MKTSMQILLDGRTDTELLEALVGALTADNATERQKVYATFDIETGANIEIAQSICRKVISRPALAKIDKNVGKI